METITVLLSTYNGERYIQDQLDSLLAQPFKINLLVRDDGSSDSTVTIIEQYKKRFNEIIIMEEHNVGATNSYHLLANEAVRQYADCDYFAFCDQDDIWLENKISVAIEKLSELDQGKPALYFSNLLMVDNDLNRLGMLLDNKAVSHNRYNALASVLTYGCTCVFNREALKCFCRLDKEHYSIFHDNWIYSVCVFLGTVIYDENSYILYRQTGNNVSGTKQVGLKLWLQRIKNIFFEKGSYRVYENIARQLLIYFKVQLQNDDVEYLNLFLGYRKKFTNKINLLFSRKTKTRRLSKNICIIGRIILNRF